MELNELKQEWHPDKNLPIRFSSSLRPYWKYWWLGKCGDEWEATLQSRLSSINDGCPVCTSLAKIDPVRAAEWHPTKNGYLTPDKVSAYSSKKFWWLGECEHEWQATLQNRTANESGCLTCAKASNITGRTLLTRYSTFAAQWHPDKNPPLTLDTSFKTIQKIWWLGECSHEWQATLKARISDGRCKVCLTAVNTEKDEGNVVSSQELRKEAIPKVIHLAGVYPNLASQWHPTKNGDLAPDKIFAGSKEEVWWEGACGHEWRASPYSRIVTDKGCLICAGEVANDVATVDPALAAQWHPTKNRLSADKVNSNSSTRVWWMCSEGHEWTATPYIRMTKDKGCLVCSGQELLTGFNDLATLNPLLAAEWHPTKNMGSARYVTAHSTSIAWWLCSTGHEWKQAVNKRETGCEQCIVLTLVRESFKEFPLLASEIHPTRNSKLGKQVRPQFTKNIWWLCEEGHEWTATPFSRMQEDKGCLVCSGVQCFPGFNDLATVIPERAANWHPTKNGTLTPQKVTLKSDSVFWWMCSEGHEWTANLKSSPTHDHSCFVCSHQSLLAAEWHPTKNTIGIDDILPGSYQDIWWLGEDCGHEWSATPSSRIRLGKGCPVCANQKTLSLEWHPTKNGMLTAKDILVLERQKLWWLCSRGHEWEESPLSRTSHGRVNKCSICLTRKREAKEANTKNSVTAPLSLEWRTVSKSIASPELVIVGINDLATTNRLLAAEWHPSKNGELSPQQVLDESNKEVWWLGTCGHEWEDKIINRFRGGNCTVCANQRVITGVNDLASVNHVLAAEWHPTKNKELTASQIHAESGMKVWWLSPCSHSWATSPAFRSRGRNCPLC